MSRLLKIFANMKDSMYAVGRRATFVGTDQYGNKYFEKSADKQHSLRKSRYIEERKDIGPHDSPEVPVEWEAWLRGRRKDPPSVEEIQRNYTKMMQTKLRANELDRKYVRGNEASSDVSEGSKITEDVTSNKQKVSFPTYDEYETAPGRKPQDR